MFGAAADAQDASGLSQNESFDDNTLAALLAGGGSADDLERMLLARIAAMQVQVADQKRALEDSAMHAAGLEAEVAAYRAVHGVLPQRRYRASRLPRALHACAPRCATRELLLVAA